MKLVKTNKNLKHQKGFSLPELIVVLLVISIVVVLALPQIISSRRLLRFSGMQKQVVASLRDARQEAMSQRAPVTFRFDNTNKIIVIYGGSFGALSAASNRVVQIADSGVTPSEITYGRPTGAPTTALADGSTMTALSSGAVDVTFQADGSVVDAANNPVNKALYLYDSKDQKGTAFAVSVLGAGGRVKIWRFSQGANVYVE